MCTHSSSFKDRTVNICALFNVLLILYFHHRSRTKLHQPNWKLICTLSIYLLEMSHEVAASVASAHHVWVFSSLSLFHVCAEDFSRTVGKYLRFFLNFSLISTHVQNNTRKKNNETKSLLNINISLLLLLHLPPLSFLLAGVWWWRKCKYAYHIFGYEKFSTKAKASGIFQMKVWVCKGKRLR